MHASDNPVHDVNKYGRHVLIVTQHLPVPFDHHPWQEAVALEKNGYIVCIICPKGPGCESSYENREGIGIYRYPRSFRPGGVLDLVNSLVWQFMLTCKVFFAAGIDAIHASSPPDMAVLVGSFFRLFFGKKLIFEHRDLLPERYASQAGKRGITYKLCCFLERLSFKSSDIFIVPNESHRRIATARGEIPQDKLFVVRPGPDLERIRMQPPSTALKKGRKFLIGCVGAMDKTDGISFLIEAASILVRSKKHSDIHFAVVGEGPETSYFKKYAALCGVADRITFTGYLPDDKMLEVMNTADICISPEGVTPASDQATRSRVMEYMALGKPIVQFEMEEARISAGEAALYAEPNDAQDMAEKIALLMDDPARRDAMGKFGRERAESELAWLHEAPKLLAAYEALFGADNKQHIKD